MFGNTRFGFSAPSHYPKEVQKLWLDVRNDLDVAGWTKDKESKFVEILNEAAKEISSDNWKEDVPKKYLINDLGFEIRFFMRYDDSKFFSVKREIDGSIVKTYRI